MSFDKMARELLMPLYERIQSLERDAEAMQKIIAKLALGEDKPGPALDDNQLLVVEKYVLDCMGHCGGQRKQDLDGVRRAIQAYFAR